MESELNVEKCPIVEKRKRIHKKCPHGKRKCRCVECNGTSICEHKKEKRNCKICKGSSICVHDIFKVRCKICNEKLFCIHNKDKRYCKKCDGSMLCRSIFCHTRGNLKYNMYCLSCTINLFPNIKTPRNYKTKENHVVQYIKTFFPNFDFIQDKRIENGCSKRRCDLRVDFGSHIIIIEIDEFSHRNTLCEEKRTLEIVEDLYYRNCVFIRFNPDNYINEKNIKIASCWKPTKQGVLIIAKGKEKEWQERLQKLTDTIQYYVENPVIKTVEIVKLFY